MQRRRIESSRNKETTKKTWVEIAIKHLHNIHKQKTKTRVQPKKSKIKQRPSQVGRELEGTLSATNLLKEEQNKRIKQNKKRTREIMTYYVVGKLKYIIEGNCTFTTQTVEQSGS